MRTSNRFAFFALIITAIISFCATASAQTPAFGREVIVDHQRIGGEPSLSIDSSDRIYVSAPFGFSTTASYVWRSVDHGVSFHLVPGNASPYGKPITCPGGGDSALAVDTKNRLYFADLQGLTDVSNSVTSDFGATWLSTCNAANDLGVDRPWIATFGNPLSGGALYQTVDQIEQCITSCGLGQVGNNIVEITRSQDGVTFKPLPAQQVEQDGIVSGIVTDSVGGVYISHTGLVDQSGNLISGSDANGNTNAVVVIRFPNGYNQTTATVLPPNMTLCQLQPATCTTNIVYKAPLDPGTGNSSAIVGEDFAPIAIDRSGNLYVVWAQAPVDTTTGNVSGSSQIFIAVSTNHGATWGAPVQVSAATPSLKTNLMPWIAAGDAGRVDIVWYGTPTLGACPNQPCGPSAITGHWSVMMAQSLNAVVNGLPNPGAAFTSATVSELSNHYGAVCTMGIGCSTGGDRGLLDFLSVVVGRKGEANVVWADAVNQNFAGGTSSALIGFNRQYVGPSLYASIGQVTGPKPASGSGTGSTDANYDANGSISPATTNLVVKSASVSRPDSLHYRFKIVVQDLTSLAVPATLGGTDAVWLVRWEIPDANGAGHTYFAAMESDAGQAPTFFDGETSTISDTHGKFMTYPGAHAIQGAYTAAAPGVITLTVPIADVGGDANATLYSITGLSVTQTAPSSTGTAIFNQIDATHAFDFTP